MLKRIVVCLVVFVCVTNIFAQTRRKTRTIVNKSQPGYYFTINTCNACCFDWHDAAVKLFKAQGIPVVIVSGQERKNSTTEAFAPIRSFEKFFYKDVSRDSEICAQITLYVGAFATEDEARNALEKFPSVLVSIIRNRGSDDIYTEAEMRKLEQAKVVQDGTTNSWAFGDDSFFFINGYQIVQAKVSSQTLANASWQTFWKQFSLAVKNKDKGAVKKLMVAEKDFWDGGGGETQNEYLRRLDKDKLWGLLQKSIVKGTTQSNYEDTIQRITTDAHLVFQFINGKWRFVGLMGD